MRRRDLPAGRARELKAPGSQGTDEEKPPRRNPGGQKEPISWASAFDRVTALPVLGLGGRDRQPHLLAQGDGQEPADRVRLPVGGFHEFLQGGAAGALQQVKDLGGLAALAGAGCRLGRLGRLGAFVSFLRRAGLLARRGLRRRNVGPLCRGPRLFGGLWLRGRGSGLGVDGYCWNAVHRAFSLGGDHRDHIDHSGLPELQADSDGNPTWAEDRRRRRTTLKTSPQTVAHFAKPARIPRRERAEDPKTIPNTARRTVKPLNKGPNFRMVDTYATPFLFHWPSCTPAWHYPGDHPHLVRKPRPCSRNHARRPLASARLGSGAPPTRWPAADSAPPTNREQSTGQQRA